MAGPGAEIVPERLHEQDRRGKSTMAEEQKKEEQEERVPVMQRVLDNPFLLLFLGITVPTVFYIVWGIMEIVSIPLVQS